MVTTMRLILLGVAFALTSCKPNLSKLQTLDNYAAGTKISNNSCSAGESSLRSDLDRFILAERIVFDDETAAASELRRELQEAMTAASTSIPGTIQQMFFAMGGYINIHKDAESLCRGLEKEYTKNAFAAEGFSSCFNPRADEGHPEVILFPSADVIKEQAVRQFGYFLSKGVSRYKKVTSEGGTDYYEYDTKNESKNFLALKLALAGEFAKDVRASNGLFDIERFVPKNRDATNALSTVMDEVFAEAFDSYYCNTWAPHDSVLAKQILEGEVEITRLDDLNNTRRVMEDLFPRTYKNFVSIVKTLKLERSSTRADTSGFLLNDPSALPTVNGPVAQQPLPSDIPTNAINHYTQAAQVQAPGPGPQLFQGRQGVQELTKALQSAPRLEPGSPEYKQMMNFLSSSTPQASQPQVQAPQDPFLNNDFRMSSRMSTIRCHGPQCQSAGPSLTSMLYPGATQPQINNYHKQVGIARREAATTAVNNADTFVVHQALISDTDRFGRPIGAVNAAEVTSSDTPSANGLNYFPTVNVPTPFGRLGVPAAAGDGTSVNGPGQTQYSGRLTQVVGLNSDGVCFETQFCMPSHAKVPDENNGIKVITKSSQVYDANTTTQRVDGAVTGVCVEGSANCPFYSAVAPSLTLKTDIRTDGGGHTGNVATTGHANYPGFRTMIGVRDTANPNMVNLYQMSGRDPVSANEENLGIPFSNVTTQHRYSRNADGTVSVNGRVLTERDRVLQIPVSEMLGSQKRTDRLPSGSAILD